MKKHFLFIGMMLLSVLFLSSCSKDDEEGANGDFNINGETYSVYMGDCSKYSSGDIAGFNARFSRQGKLPSLSLRLTGHDKWEVGDNILKFIYVKEYVIDYTDRDFHYENETGEIIVKSIANSCITLEFKNFSFVRKFREISDTFTMSGTVEYRITQ